MTPPVRVPFFLFLLATGAAGQGPAFDSPGTSTYSRLGQTTRFSTEFNPAIGLVIDGFADYANVDRGSDGFDAEVRLLEFNASAHVDPEAWAYVVLTSEDLESPEVEEAAVEYLGLEGNATVKAGRFFVDFGKQMQTHLEELRTLERPLVLREYLGEELAGTGVQYDSWFAVDDETPVRFSLGIFASLLGEEEDDTVPVGVVPDRKDLDELSFAGRITGMRDVGDSGVLQVGASVRHVPEFDFELESAGLLAEGLSNTVYGVDATYSRADETALSRWLVGGELLVFDGDLAAAADDPVTPTNLLVVDDTATGFFVYGDYGWSKRDSAGLQFSLADLADTPSDDASELDLYYTRHLTEFRRLRLGVTIGDGDSGEDFERVYIQFTNFFGSHAHGINW